ncbi:hypothetical protein [Tannerella forsythia]
MKIQQFNIEDEKKKNSFRVPEGYMEGLPERIMAGLPERPQQKENQAVSMAEKMRPWLYLAASFIGLLLIFKGIQEGGCKKSIRSIRCLWKRKHPNPR